MDEGTWRDERGKDKQHCGSKARRCEIYTPAALNSKKKSMEKQTALDAFSGVLRGGVCVLEFQRKLVISNVRFMEGSSLFKKGCLEKINNSMQMEEMHFNA